MVAIASQDAQVFCGLPSPCECRHCINPVARIKFRGYAPANRNALYNPGLPHPRQETIWLSQLTKNLKQNSRNWKNRVADDAAARSNSAWAKREASASTGWGAFPLRFIMSNG